MEKKYVCVGEYETLCRPRENFHNLLPIYVCMYMYIYIYVCIDDRKMITEETDGLNYIQHQMNDLHIP